MTYCEIVAECLEKDPTLLDSAISTALTWLEQGHSAPQRLVSWLDLLRSAKQSQEAFRRVTFLLRDPSEEAALWRSFHPFAGILPREERRQASDLCNFRH
jgi:hypothetical protein